MWFVSLLRSLTPLRSPQGRARQRPRAPRFRPQFDCLEDRCVPSTLTVTSTADSGPGTLRADIAAAQPGDTIVFSPSLAGQTITLTSGELVVNKSLTIQGPGAGQLAISGNQASRVFDVVGATTNVTLSGLTITQGNSGGANGGFGGGILDNGATLTVSGCTLSANGLANEGGAICNLNGVLTVSGCTLSGNRATEGGAIDNGSGNSGGSATVTNCTLSGNFASSEGGAIVNGTTGAMTVTGCTLSDNTSQGVGGGIDNWGTLSVTNSTLSGNSAIGPDGSGNQNLGGAVYTIGYVTGKKNHTVVTGAMTMTGCTVTGNSAYYGGGYYNASSSAIPLTINDNTLADNSCIYGTSAGYASYIYYGPWQGSGNTVTYV
jgi:hypothetical protein